MERFHGGLEMPFRWAVALAVMASVVAAPSVLPEARAAGETVTTIPLAAGSEPEGIAIAPDGTAYSVNLGTATLSRIPAGAAAPAENLPTGGSRPYSAAALSTGQIFVTNRGSGTVARIVPGRLAVPRLYPVGSEPWGVTATPDDTVYASVRGEDTLVRIDRGSVIVNSTIPLLAGSEPKDLAYSTVDRRLYVANSATGTLGRVNPANGSVEYLPLPAGAEPRGVAVARDGSVYVTDIGLGAVHWFRSGANTVTRTTVLPGESFPSDAAAVSDGSVLVSMYDTGHVTRFRDGVRGDSIDLGADIGPDRIAVGVDGTAYTANFRGDSVSRITPPPPPDLGQVTTLRAERIGRHRAKLKSRVTSVDRAMTVRFRVARNRTLTRRVTVVRRVGTVQAGRQRLLAKKVFGLKRQTRYWYRAETTSAGSLVTGSVRRFRTR